MSHGAPMCSANWAAAASRGGLPAGEAEEIKVIRVIVSHSAQSCRQEQQKQQRRQEGGR